MAILSIMQFIQKVPVFPCVAYDQKLENVPEKLAARNCVVVQKWALS
jgi:hypothetical protein